MNNKNIYLIIILSVLALIARLIWHLPNFSPLASLILFAGYYTPKKYWPLPFVSLFISDLILGFYAWPVMLSVYAASALNLYLGKLLQKNDTALNIASSTLASALIFFFVTNFAVWASGDWYAHNLSGLSLCFALAVPFFKNTLLSNILYTGLIFAPVKVFATVRSKQVLSNK
jgi:hypothetical protein